MGALNYLIRHQTKCRFFSCQSFNPPPVTSCRRVVVTGLGMVTPLGCGVEMTWRRSVEGHCGVRALLPTDLRMNYFDEATVAQTYDQLTSKVAAIVPCGKEDGQFDEQQWLQSKDHKSITRFIAYALCSADEALRDANGLPTEPEKERTGVSVGGGIGSISDVLDAAHMICEKRLRRLSPFFIPRILINMASGHVSMKYGFQGPNHAAVTACATGAHSIGDATRMIQFGDADIMVAGGTESSIDALSIAGFCRSRALTTKHHSLPQESSRPFDCDRDGFVSYELMESILKVYIYQDGSKPIFHWPELKGIYASEGWFMKLMENNKNFIVKDPNKAHLFYLPYSAHRLEQVLYVPNSHNFQPLMIFLRNYVNMISVKHPFWNRTRGTDHFLVACHDWGPYTTKWHHELRVNTIKALCNADVSEGVFIRGKDVSLPETSIRNPRRPLRNIGGKPASQRTILAFFSGQMHGRVRPILLQHWHGRDDDMKIYGPLPKGIAKKMSYAEHMKSSKYCICPMGYEVNSPRIVEAIYFECVPVIIADNFVLPFEEVLDWSAFSVVVAEKDIANLKEILLRIPQRKYITMQMNVKKLQNHFLWHSKPVKYDIFHLILHSLWFNRLNQIPTTK